MGIYNSYMIVGHRPRNLGVKDEAVVQSVLDKLNEATSKELGYGDWEPWTMLGPKLWEDAGNAVNVFGPVFVTSLKNTPSAVIADVVSKIDWYELGYYCKPPMLIHHFDHIDGPEEVEWQPIKPDEDKP